MLFQEMTGHTFLNMVGCVHNSALVSLGNNILLLYRSLSAHCRQGSYGKVYLAKDDPLESFGHFPAAVQTTTSSAELLRIICGRETQLAASRAAHSEDKRNDKVSAVKVQAAQFGRESPRPRLGCAGRWFWFPSFVVGDHVVLVEFLCHFLGDCSILLYHFAVARWVILDEVFVWRALGQQLRPLLCETRAPAS